MLYDAIWQRSEEKRHREHGQPHLSCWTDLKSRSSSKHPCQALGDVLQHWWSERWSLKLSETHKTVKALVKAAVKAWFPQSEESFGRNHGRNHKSGWGSTWLSFHSGMLILAIRRNQTSTIFNHPLNTTNQSSTSVKTSERGILLCLPSQKLRCAVQIQHRHISTYFNTCQHCVTLYGIDWYCMILHDIVNICQHCHCVCFDLPVMSLHVSAHPPGPVVLQLLETSLQLGTAWHRVLEWYWQILTILYNI